MKTYLIPLLLLTLLLSCSNSMTISEPLESNQNVDITEDTYSLEKYKNKLEIILNNHSKLDITISINENNDDIIFQGIPEDITTLLEIALKEEHNTYENNTQSRGWLPKKKYHMKLTIVSANIFTVLTSGQLLFVFDNFKAYNNFSAWCYTKLKTKIISTTFGYTFSEYHKGYVNEGFYLNPSNKNPISIYELGIIEGSILKQLENFL